MTSDVLEEEGEQARGREDEEEEKEEWVTDRLFVRNLCYSTSEEDIRRHFQQQSFEIAEVHLVREKETKKSKGFAYVRFKQPQQAEEAMKLLDSSILQGRLLHLMPAKQQKEAEATLRGRAKGHGAVMTSVQAEREERRKKEEQEGNIKSWSTFFMRQDTVAAAVALHYGISVRELLNPEGSSAEAAVRMALGETHVIAETKSQLAAAGADVDLLEAFAREKQKNGEARSMQAILVKNLPFVVDEEELSGLFARFGPISRIVLPTTKALALVEMADEGDARVAFKSLAYKRLRNVPLYLEWAPEAVFKRRASEEAVVRDAAATSEAAGGGGVGGAGRGEGGGEEVRGRKVAVEVLQMKQKKPAEQREEGRDKRQQMGAEREDLTADGVDASVSLVEVGGDGVEEVVIAQMRNELQEGAEGENDDAVANARCVFVKNLNFATTEQRLRRHFENSLKDGKQQVVATTLKKKKAKNGALLSMGFGFVDFKSHEAAKEAISKLQGSSLDGHSLALQLSTREAAAGRGERGAEKTKSNAKFSGTKIIVRNVAFEATRKEIQQLFTPFGKVKSVRLPKKMDGSHRGFAFVEFLTQQEALNAFNALSNTHLYGRHLVLEPAKEAEGLDEIRARTSLQFGDGGQGGRNAKRQKLLEVEDEMELE